MHWEPRIRDVIGRLKVSLHQNVYEADFEYGAQPLRWGSLVANGGTVAHVPGSGGVRMRVPTTSGAVAIRQSRPYHRYQPGKTMFMASAIVLGPAQSGNVQRVGFFDDSNGVFFEDAGPTPLNPSGMVVVVRSDVTGQVVDTRIPSNQWSCDRALRETINWNAIQMIFIEYAWYGAGMCRWGVFVDGEPRILHQIGFGNSPGQLVPWSRTGNLPVRYEQRNTATIAAQNDMFHYGVSVLVEGRIDDQRGFTYAYGNPQSAPRRAVSAGANRFPILSYRGRPVGTVVASNNGTGGLGVPAINGGAITGSSPMGMLVANSNFPAGGLVGLMVYWPSLNQTARITSNEVNSITYVDNVLGTPVASAPGAGIAYQIGLINRGQMLPRRLQLTSDNPVFVEIFVSRPGSQINLTGANFVVNAAAPNSFAEIDASATAFTLSGECVYSLFVPANNPVDQQIDTLFPLLNSIRGDQPDILTVACTNPGGSTANCSVQIIGQEAMS
jgi:hypothetical protein